MDILFYIVLILGAYLIGSIPFGFLIGKLHGVDIRQVGSGNIGATNVTRTVGKIQGRICFALDFAKGALPALVSQIAYPEEAWLTFCCCALAVLGHIFPVYLKFKGGKGISTAAGATLALAPLPLLGAAIIWVAGFLLWRYVSLASICAAVTLPLLAWLLRWLDVGSAAARNEYTLIFLGILSLVTIIRHIGNIRRLLAGTESRFDKTKEETAEKPKEEPKTETGNAPVSQEGSSQKPEE